MPYARYCAALDATPGTPLPSWQAIPPAPAAAYKEAALATFDPAGAALAFETSGTTRGTGGRHYMRTSSLYDAALLAGFDRFMLADGLRLAYLNLVPDPQEHPHSSLGYMMATIARVRGEGEARWYVRGGTLALDDLFADLRGARVPVCIATTAFALVAVLDEADERGLRFSLPPGSRIMETGGFKGRTRIVAREELYVRACDVFAIAPSQIAAEYGMTELTSQWYDTPVALSPSTARCARAQDGLVDVRLKSGPTWLRARAVGPDGKALPDGVVGALVHVDLANLWSCVAVQTEDLGARFGSKIALLGRERGAELRGCSLDAETLAVR